MEYKGKNIIHKVLENLFETYSKRVPDVSKITNALIENGIVKSQKEISNDHIAFRTLGINNLGIQSLERIFIKHGYKKRDYYYFEAKKLNAYWYEPPFDNLPRIFISELVVKDLSEKAIRIIDSYTSNIKKDPTEALDLNNHRAIIDYLQTPQWKLPTIEDYEYLLKESEYAAWVIYNRYYLNHYTISVHDLKNKYKTIEEFNGFLKDLGIKLNNSGGEIKRSKDNLLLQSSTISNKIRAKFKNGEKEIAGSYVEFAERKILPQFSDLPESEIKREHRKEGFDTNNANHIFESTYTTQIKKAHQ